MNDNDREEIPSVLNRLPFVRWDRLVDDGDSVVVYGWIGRDDGRSDFVVATFRADSGEIFTSSAERSAEIARLVTGSDDGHVECQRVEDVFGDLVDNAIRLERA